MQSRIHGASRLFKALSEIKPELNYVIGVQTGTLAKAKLINLPDSLSQGITLGWNYSDGICSLLSAGLSLLDEDSASCEKRLKAFFQVAPGLQLIALTAYNPTRYAAPSFALATLADFGIALNEMLSAYQLTMPDAEDPHGRIINATRKKKYEIEFSKKMVDCLVKGLSFVGMTCLAFPSPITQSTGLMLTNACSFYYAIKNSGKIAEAAGMVSDTDFFSPLEEAPSREEWPDENTPLLGIRERRGFTLP